METQSFIYCLKFLEIYFYFICISVLLACISVLRVYSEPVEGNVLLYVYLCVMCILCLRGLEEDVRPPNLKLQSAVSQHVDDGY